MNMKEIRLTAGTGLHVEPGTSMKRHSGPTLRGYAAVFNSLSHDLGNFRETINPGAFRGTLKTRGVLALYGHDRLALLGRTSTGSLKLHEDGYGLAFQLHLPSTQLGRDIAELVADGELSQMSFGFLVPPNGDTWSREGTRNIRTLREVILYEVSIVSEPAYERTSVALRKALDAVLAAALAARRERLEQLVSR